MCVCIGGDGHWQDSFTADDSLGFTTPLRLWDLLHCQDDSDPHTADTADECFDTPLFTKTRRGHGREEQGRVLWNYEWLPACHGRYSSALSALEAETTRLRKQMRVLGKKGGDKVRRSAGWRELSDGLSDGYMALTPEDGAL